MSIQPPGPARGYRLLPLDLNYSDDGQVFAMAFAERVSMVSIIRWAALRPGLRPLASLGRSVIYPDSSIFEE
ncbi:hypothetical protein GFM13_09215 [Rhizobium leguminosarum bv. viciae]|nr:hypothetical protein [Rhizobium leguminosarum bv. viciae]